MFAKTKPDSNQRKGTAKVKAEFPKSKYTQGFAPLKTIVKEENTKRELVKL
jgi:hypothetical protein